MTSFTEADARTHVRKIADHILQLPEIKQAQQNRIANDQRRHDQIQALIKKIPECQTKKAIEAFVASSPILSNVYAEGAVSRLLEKGGLLDEDWKKIIDGRAGNIRRDVSRVFDDLFKNVDALRSIDNRLADLDPNSTAKPSDGGPSHNYYINNTLKPEVGKLLEEDLRKDAQTKLNTHAKDSPDKAALRIKTAQSLGLKGYKDPTQDAVKTTSAASSYNERALVAESVQAHMDVLKAGGSRPDKYVAARQIKDRVAYLKKDPALYQFFSGPEVSNADRKKLMLASTYGEVSFLRTLTSRVKNGAAVNTVVHPYTRARYSEPVANELIKQNLAKKEGANVIHAVRVRAPGPAASA